jgi:hypothetical protein
MLLNVPELFCENILFVGAGGGFDIFGAIPLIHDYPIHNYPLNKFDAIPHNFTLANFGNNTDETLRIAQKEDIEYQLWDLKEYTYLNIPQIYVLGRQGVLNTYDSLQKIVDENKIDSIMVIDGGVDSLMRGNEQDSGTILEDFIVLAAVNKIKVKNKYLICLGFGCETEERLNHARALENISALMKTGDFIGSCSLTKNMQCYEKYYDICEKAWTNNRVSHIQGKVIAAVEGNFGNVKIKGMDARLAQPAPTEHGLFAHNFISPLMGIYWFFNLQGVINNNLIIPYIDKSRTFADAKILLRQYFENNPPSKSHYLLPI